MFTLVCSGGKKMVNFHGTCDLPPSLSQTTASVNKEEERKMYHGRFSDRAVFFVPIVLVVTV